ncbi:preprotein translocase subunit SecE [Clostridium acetobutylicum]|uniref:preprotein translocase subunit SecE n=1 Tax=Clostridium acetobutylicum TaxID=1488 RepID=UPI0035A307FA
MGLKLIGLLGLQNWILKKTTIAVLTFCAAYIIVVAIMDYGFNNLFRVIFK